MENAAIRKSSFGIGDIIRASFDYTKGFKITAWAMLLIFFAVNYIVYGVTMLFSPTADVGTPEFIYNSMLTSLLAIPIIAPLTTGLYMGMINHVRGERVSYKIMFHYYPMVKKLAVASLFIHIINSIVFISTDMLAVYLDSKIVMVLSHLATYCVGLLYIFTLPLVADKSLGAWEAMELSRKIVMNHFFKIFVLLVALGIIMGISAIPLGIGMIWTAPMMYIAGALLYRMFFDGVDCAVLINKNGQAAS